MRPAAAALTALEVSVRGGGATLARPEHVRVHAEAHRAARVPPLEARTPEDPVEALGLRLPLYRRRARHDHRPHLRVDAPTADDPCGQPEILDAGVRTGAD